MLSQAQVDELCRSFVEYVRTSREPLTVQDVADRLGITPSNGRQVAEALIGRGQMFTEAGGPGYVRLIEISRRLSVD